MICAYCASVFMSGRSIKIFEYDDGTVVRPKPVRATLESGSVGLERLLVLAKLHPKYRLLIDDRIVRDFTPVTQVGGTLACAVHYFDALEAWRYGK